MQYDDYRKLDLYRKADELITKVYSLTKNYPKEELFGIVSQIRRAASSVLANFSEGYARKSVKEKKQFYSVSLGSLNEVGYFLELSKKLGYLKESDFHELTLLQTDVRKLFYGYVRGIDRRNSVSGLRSPVSGSGQTLIETVVAIFILASGLSAGLALAVFAFSSTANNIERVTATSLAREGIEVVRRMRDSNWLRDSIATADGSDCNTLPAGEPCYEDWLDQQYNINGSCSSFTIGANGLPACANAFDGGRRTRVAFDSSVPNSSRWTMTTAAGTPNACFYRLYHRPGASGGGFEPSSSCPAGVGWTTTSFFRKVNIINLNTGTADNESQILIRSMVWWYGKRCNNTLTNLTNANQTRCKIIVEDYLTNWKNYEL